MNLLTNLKKPLQPRVDIYITLQPANSAKLHLLSLRQTLMLTGKLLFLFCFLLKLIFLNNFQLISKTIYNKPLWKNKFSIKYIIQFLKTFS